MGRLPAHTQPGGDLWPPDAQTNSLVNQLGECRFCPPLCNPVALDLLQHLGGSHPRSRLRLAWRLLLRIYAKCVVGQDELAKRRTAKRCARTDTASPPADPGALQQAVASGRDRDGQQLG
jgi:hypothetical protein